MQAGARYLDFNAVLQRSASVLREALDGSTRGSASAPCPHCELRHALGLRPFGMGEAAAAFQASQKLS